MKKNIGITDRIIRLVVAFTIFNFIETWQGNVQLAFGLLAGNLVFTALNQCSIVYLLFKVSTRKAGLLQS
ncbi:MAG: DUF2892 domain-containing protein [Flavobacterium sp.]|nr:MAG: DUF2892 domain-containing protein [Flavobacterium sp.]